MTLPGSAPASEASIGAGAISSLSPAGATLRRETLKADDARRPSAGRRAVLGEDRQETSEPRSVSPMGSFVKKGSADLVPMRLPK